MSNELAGPLLGIDPLVAIYPARNGTARVVTRCCGTTLICLDTPEGIGLAISTHLRGQHGYRGPDVRVNHRETECRYCLGRFPVPATPADRDELVREHAAVCPSLPDELREQA